MIIYPVFMDRPARSLATRFAPRDRPNGNLSASDQSPDWRSNRILRALPASEFAAIAAKLEEVRLEQRDVIFEQEKPITHVFFPTSAVVSFVSMLSAKNAVEVGTVGCEGFAGLPVFLSDDTSSVRAVIQVPGMALRMSTADFHEVSDGDSALRTLLLRYTQAFITQVAQTAVCNTAHLLDSRCARWLLMTHDRVGGDQFPLTHEFLAYMLGVQRPGVTIAMRHLQKMNLIRYSRGKVSIVDRGGLEKLSCVCYEVVRTHFARMLPGAA